MASWFNLVVDWASILGCIISIYLLYKVKQLTAARAAEREFMKKILFVDELDSEICSLIDLFTTEKHLTDGQVRATSLAELRGKLIGALGTVEELYGSEVQKYPLYPTAYFTNEFFRTVVAKAKKTVTIVSFHNRRLADYGNLEVLRKLVQSGREVTLLTLSPDAEEPILEFTRRKLPSAPATTQEFQQQIRKNCEAILTFLGKKAHGHSAGYQFYVVLPRIHMTKIDDYIYVGFPNYDPDNLVAKHKGKRVNPYLKVPAKSSFGKFLQLQLSYVLHHSSPAASAHTISASDP